jgi:PAS domain S-box-containing protein
MLEIMRLLLSESCELRSAAEDASIPSACTLPSAMHPPPDSGGDEGRLDARTKEELAAELAVMNGLHHLSTRLLAATELGPLLEEILEATIALLAADFGTIQLWDPATGVLTLAAQRGFQQDFLDSFDHVHAGTGSWGVALERRARVVVEDVRTDPLFAPHVPIAASAGFRAVQSTPLFSRTGEPLGMISTHFRQPHRPADRDLWFTDFYARQAAELIERKRSDDSLRAAKVRTETILESITDQFFALSKDWRFTYFNRHAAAQMRALGKDPNALIGQVLWEVFPHVPNEEALRRVMTERMAIKDELFYAPLDQWVENDMCPSPDGGIVTFQRYITSRKQTEAALRASEERFRRYFDLGLIGMAITSPTKGILEVNDELCRILGYERQELLRMTWVEMSHPDDIALDVAHFQRVLAGEIDGYSIDKRWVRKDGRIVDGIMAARCVRRTDGTVEYFVGLVQDITERKSAERRLGESERRLHALEVELAHVARATTLGELAASIAHEVNQPLAAIVMNAQACSRWLGANPPDLREAHTAMNRVVGDANRAAEVIARIRAFLQQGEPQLVAVNLSEVIADVVAIVQGEISVQGVSVAVRPGIGLPAVSADRIQLQQVVLNLVVNAIEAMSPVPARARTLGIEAGRHGTDALRVAVRDSGVGITSAHRDRIFDAFYTTKPHGMGMGLAISRSIIEAHGGRLWATANDGPGSTFQFTVPLWIPPAS